MIDLAKETLISHTETSRLFPPGRRGKEPHRATIYRWMTTGVRGVRLESVKLPNGRATSREAVERFLKALSTLDERENPFRKPTAPTLEQRRRRLADAERELDEMGIKTIDERENPFRKPTAPTLEQQHRRLADAERELDEQGIE